MALGAGRLRIPGGHLSDLMGVEVRGMPLTALFTPPARRVLSAILDDVFKTPAVAHLVLSAAAAPERPLLPARMLLLPLEDDVGQITRILGCLISKGEIGESPRRFDVEAKQLRRLFPSDGVVPDMVTSCETNAGPSQGFAESKTPFQRTSNQRRDPPYLYLVQSDD